MVLAGQVNKDLVNLTAHGGKAYRSLRIDDQMIKVRKQSATNWAMSDALPTSTYPSFRITSIKVISGHLDDRDRYQWPGLQYQCRYGCGSDCRRPKCRMYAVHDQYRRRIKRSVRSRFTVDGNYLEQSRQLEQDGIIALPAA